MAEASEIVKRLGGAELLASRLGISLKAIEMWERRDRIPFSRHFQLMLLANERGVKLSFEELFTQSQRAA